MKKLVYVLFLVAFSSVAQEKYSTYNSSYFKKDYDILVSKKDEKSFDFYISTTSKDKLSKEALIVIEYQKIEDFNKLLLNLKNKYIEWKKIAIENKVTDLNKDVEDNSIKVSAGFLYGKWNFDFNVSLSGSFKILSSKYLMLLKSDELVASNNQYIKSDGLYFVFESEAEFDDLISKLNIEKVNSFLNSSKAKEDLFKK